MPLWLHKVLPVFALPLGACILLAAAGAMFGKRKLVWAACALLYVAGTPIVGNAVLGTLEDWFPYVEVEDCPAVDAAVVLGGFMPDDQRSARGTLDWREGVDRFERGVELWQAQKSRYLVFTQDYGAKSAALKRGVAPDRLVVLDVEGNTASEAETVRRLMGERGWKRIVLVTTAWHLPRAAYLFSKAGVEFTPFPADYWAPRRTKMQATAFLPGSEGIEKTEIALREWYGLAYYKLLKR